MSRKSYSHVHVYRLRTETSTSFRCAEDGCPHLLAGDLVLGRQARCPVCQKAFFVRDFNMNECMIDRTITCGCEFPAQLELNLVNKPEGEKFVSDDPFADILRNAREKP